MCLEQTPSAFDFTLDQARLHEAQSRSNVLPLLEQARPIRRQKLEPLPDDKLSRSIGLKRTQGVWTPINYDKAQVYSIPITIYSSNEGAVVSAVENMDANRAITSVTQLKPEDQATERNLQKLLRGIEEGRFKNIAVVNAHGEYTYQTGLGFWGYYGEGDEPRMVFKAVKALINAKHDLIILAICNPGRTRLPETSISVPVLYSLGSVNAVGNVPNSKLTYVGPEL